MNKFEHSFVLLDSNKYIQMKPLKKIIVVIKKNRLCDISAIERNFIAPFQRLGSMLAILQYSQYYKFSYDVRGE